MRWFILILILTVSVGAEEKIAWYSSWAEATAAAKTAGRPIFLMAAAPQCHGISGIW